MSADFRLNESRDTQVRGEKKRKRFVLGVFLGFLFREIRIPPVTVRSRGEWIWDDS